MARQFVRVRSKEGARHEYSIDKKLYERNTEKYELVGDGKPFTTPLAPTFIEPTKPAQASGKAKEAK